MASVIFSIFEDLVGAVKSAVPERNIFLGSRPTLPEATEKLDKYVVIELPVSIEDIAVGNKKFVLQTTGVFYLFTRAKKDRTFRVNELSEFLSSIESLFPISGKYCVAADPVVLLRGSDDYGLLRFHSISILVWGYSINN